MSKSGGSLFVALIAAVCLVGCAQPEDSPLRAAQAGDTVISDSELQARQDVIGDVLSDALPDDFMMSLQMNGATRQLEFTVTSNIARSESELWAVKDALVDVLDANFSSEELFGFAVVASVSTESGGIDFQIDRVSFS